MIRRHLMALRVALMLGDGLSAVLVFLGVSFLRFRDGDPTDLWRDVGIDIRLAALLFAVTWVGTLWAMGLYRLSVRWRLWTEMRDIARTALVVVAVTLSTLFIVKQEDVSRLFLAFLFVAQPAVTLAGRILLRYGFEAIRRNGHDARYMLVAGTGRLAQEFADRVESHPGLGHADHRPPVGAGRTESVVTRPILGSVEDIEEILHSQVVDEVAVCLPPTAAQYLEPITGLAAGEGKTVRIPVDPVQEILPTRLPGGVRRLPGALADPRRAARGRVSSPSACSTSWGPASASCCSAPCSSAPRSCCSCARAHRSCSVRPGSGCTAARSAIYKFRTMVPDAEEQLDEVQHLNERSGVSLQGQATIPRITPRRPMAAAHLDRRAAQLWNVLTGSMSLVGPRPPLPNEVAEYDIWHRRRLSMKPGITGLWQVEARHEPDFDRWVEHDLIYIDGWSIWLDLKILAKTLPALLAHGGH